MPDKLLQERLEIFTPEYRDFVMSDFTDVVGAEAQSEYGFDDDTRAAFENMVFLHIILFLNRIELTEAVIEECGLSVSDALEVINTTLTKLPKEMVTAQQEAVLSLTDSRGEMVAEKDRFGHTSTLPSQKQSVYLYVKTTQTIDNLCKKYSLTKVETIEVCHTLLGDIILGFYKIEDTVPLLQQELGIDAKTAALLGADVLDFLAPLSDPDFVIPVTVRQDDSDTTDSAEEVQNKPPLFDTLASIKEDSFASPYAPAANIAPEIHTMASDASVVRAQFEPVVEQVYSSEQPVIRKNLSDTPSYASPFNQAPRDTTPKAPIEPPRWGV